jgi:predicted DNA-binding protein (UPF0251 family)
MPRPVKCRRVEFVPDARFFKPAGIPVRDLEEVDLSLDELESIRLADLEGLYQEDAAGRMSVSRQTFANILASARAKVAECLILGKALRIHGGKIEAGERRFVCKSCSHSWGTPFGSACPSSCPRCEGVDIRPVLHGRGCEKDPGTGCMRRKRCCRKNNQEEPV